MYKRISLLQRLNASIETLKWVIFFVILFLIRIPFFDISNLHAVYLLLFIAAIIYLFNYRFVRPRVSYEVHVFIEYIFHTVFITLFVLYSGYLSSFFFIFFYLTIVGVALRIRAHYSLPIFFLTFLALICIAGIDPSFDLVILLRDIFTIVLLYSIGYAIRKEFDIVTRQSINEQVRIKKLQETSRVKDEFVFTVAHDLRSPLTTIVLQTDLLQRGTYGPLSPKMEKAIQTIEGTSKRLVMLLDDLLSISRIEARRVTVAINRVDIATLLSEIIEAFDQKAKERGVKLQIKKTTPLFFQTDETKAKEIFTNIIDNAIKYSRSNESVSIDYKRMQKAVVIAVTDKGYGIPENEKSRIFEKFYRSQNVKRIKADGTGLGLFITKRLTHMLHGKIWFRSTEGKGTTFFIALPLRAVSPPPVRQTPHRSGAGQASSDAPLVRSIHARGPEAVKR